MTYLAYLAAISLGVPSLRQSHVWPETSTGHAHNDYVQKRPLESALESKFRSIEVDVFPVEGDLWVAHTRKELASTKRIDGMYLAPLMERIKRNGGSVYGDGREVILLVDIKTEGEVSYSILKQLIRPYHAFLTSCRGGKVTHRAVQMILSGVRPLNLIQQESVRFLFADGRIEDFSRSTRASEIPLISADWSSLFSWKGASNFSAVDRLKLKKMVRFAHENGQIVRFWATPEDPELWNVLRLSGVDLIGTDIHPKLSSFLAKGQNSQD